MFTKFFTNQISYKEFSEHVSQNNDVYSSLEFYKMFGHTGTFDHIFLGSSLEYMLKFPQVYFQKVFQESYPEHLIELIQDKFSKFKSRIYTEQFKPELLNELFKIDSKTNFKKLFVNKDGNFTMKSSGFEYVANFSGTLWNVSDEFKENIKEK